MAQAQPQTRPDAKVNLPPGRERVADVNRPDFSSKWVLILHFFAYAQPAYKIIDRSLSESFVASGLNFNNLRIAFLDLARNPGQEYRSRLADFFRLARRIFSDAEKGAFQTAFHPDQPN